MNALNHKTESEKAKVRQVVDTGVNKKLILEGKLKGTEASQGRKRDEAEENKQKFVSLWHQRQVQGGVGGRAGAKLKTMVYVIRRVSECVGKILRSKVGNRRVLV